MKIEIKNINLKSIILSAFPLLVFVLCLVNYVLQVSSMPDMSLMQQILQIILWTLVDTMVYLVLIVISAFVYNLFCSFGMRGLTFTVEEPATKEEVKEEN
ncbi:MAG: hypothetical protein J5594_05375 [Elusimicrobiaceae bacterium]|nr:hypothetical protein [Elusimicrobiaceae bacterium]